MNSHLTELVKAANHNRALLKRSRPPAGHCFIYCLHSKKLNMSYVGKTKQSMGNRIRLHRHPVGKCAGTQLFALGDPEWSILEIVASDHAGDREEWHIAHTRSATNVNARSVPLEGAALLRTSMRYWLVGSIGRRDDRALGCDEDIFILVQMQVQDGCCWQCMREGRRYHL